MPSSADFSAPPLARLGRARRGGFSSAQDGARPRSASSEGRPARIPPEAGTWSKTVLWLLAALYLFGPLSLFLASPALVFLRLLGSARLSPVDLLAWGLYAALSGSLCPCSGFYYAELRGVCRIDVL